MKNRAEGIGVGAETVYMLHPDFSVSLFRFQYNENSLETSSPSPLDLIAILGIPSSLDLVKPFCTPP